MKRAAKLHWNVFIENFNGRRIEPYDIFTHCGFLRDLKKANKEIADDSEFLDKVKSWLQYYFWAKCEYEVVIGSLFGNGESDRKIDVYEQVTANWDVFSEYLLSHRDSIKRMHYNV